MQPITGNRTLANLLVAVLLALTLISCTSSSAGDMADLESQLEGTVSISGAWALYPLMVRWSEEFQKLHPGVKCDISAGGAGRGMADALAGAVDIFPDSLLGPAASLPLTVFFQLGTPFPSVQQRAYASALVLTLDGRARGMWPCRADVLESA